MNPMNDAEVTAKRFRRYPTSEADAHHALLLDVDSVDEADARWVALHDDRAGARAVTKEAHAAHQRSVGDARCREDDAVAGREVLGGVDAGRIRNAHGAAPLFVLRLVDHESCENLAVQAAHRGGSEHAFRRAAGAHHRVYARADDRGRDTGRQVTVADQSDPRAGRADIGDQLLVPRTIEHDDDEVLDVAAERLRDRGEVFRRRRVKADGGLRARADDQLFHVEIRRMEQPALARRGEHRDGVGFAGGAKIRPLERIDRDLHGGQRAPWKLPARRHTDLLTDVEHRRLVALPFPDDDGAVDRHGVERFAHRLDGGLIRLVTIALAHRVRTGDRRLLDDAQEVEGEI